MPARLLEDGWAIGEHDNPFIVCFFAGRADIGALESYSLRAVHWGRLTIKVLRANAVPALQLVGMFRAGHLWPSPQRFHGRCAYCLLHFSHLQRTWNRAARQGYLTTPPSLGRTHRMATRSGMEVARASAPWVQSLYSPLRRNYVPTSGGELGHGHCCTFRGGGGGLRQLRGHGGGHRE